MGFDLASIMKGGVEGVLSSVGDIIGRFKATPDIAAKAQADIAVASAELEKAQALYDNQLLVAQAEINKIEAGSSDKFTSRWRPFVGWTCGVGLAYAGILSPFLSWISVWIATGKPGPAPEVDTSQLIPILLGMLGVGTMRSFDKLKGTARK